MKKISYSVTYMQIVENEEPDIIQCNKFKVACCNLNNKKGVKFLDLAYLTNKIRYNQLYSKSELKQMISRYRIYVKGYGIITNDNFKYFMKEVC